MQLWKGDSASRHPPGRGGRGPGERRGRPAGVRAWGQAVAGRPRSSQSRLRPFRCGAVIPRRTPRRAEGEPAGRATVPAHLRGSNRRGAVAAEESDCLAPARSRQTFPPSRLASPAPLPQGCPSRARSGGTVKTVTAPTFELIQTRQRRAARPRPGLRRAPPPVPANPLASLLSPPSPPST